MNFPTLWINLVMECITTISYKILVDREQSYKFMPSKRLWQGDPISPYLFILLVNVLLAILHATQQGHLQGVKVSQHPPSITHLFYVDDLIIFFKVTRESCKHLNNILQTFSITSRLYINRQKSSIWFNRNNPPYIKSQVVVILNFNIVDKLDKYLGSYITNLVDKRKIGQEIIQKLSKKFQGWKTILLSQANRLTLYKIVLRSIPIYHIATTILLDRDLSQIMELINKFW